MPPTLRELQTALAAYLAGEARLDLEAAVVGDSIPAAARLRVHRHHVRDSLVAALAATFPTVRAVVGEDFFRRLAHAFVAATLPVQPVLAEYGAGLPDFLGAYPSAAALPYLADIARLDEALNDGETAVFTRVNQCLVVPCMHVGARPQEQLHQRQRSKEACRQCQRAVVVHHG